MSVAFSRRRRILVSAIALACAALLFRNQLASALVVRGDEYLYRSNLSAAAERYRRALFFDPDCAAAVDRYAFVALLSRSSASIRGGVAISSAYLGRHGSDAVVLRDRGMLYMLVRRYENAQTDFERAGRSTGNPQDLVFAGWAARRAGNRARARRLWLRALHLKPAFPAALASLRDGDA